MEILFVREESAFFWAAFLFLSQALGAVGLRAVGTSVSAVYPDRRDSCCGAGSLSEALLWLQVKDMEEI